MKQYFLISTDHLEDSLWFRDEEDFVVGMNMVAVQASISDAIVLAFILMSNHVHFVLYGTEKEAIEFINRYKGRYSQYYRRKWGVKEFLRLNHADIQVLPNTLETLERAIAYVLMNCVAANICAHPTQYPWGCGNCFFKVDIKGATNTIPGGRRVKDLSKRALARLLHSDAESLPGEWIISDAGYVIPESYVPVDFVENLFRTPTRMDYFLRSSSKAKKKLEKGEDALPSFKDQVILAAVPDLCQSLFQKPSFKTLLPDEKQEVLRQLKYRFSAGPNQLGRVCGLSYSETARLLDEFG